MGETKLGLLARKEMLGRSILAESGMTQGNNSTLGYSEKSTRDIPSYGWNAIKLNCKFSRIRRRQNCAKNKQYSKSSMDHSEIVPAPTCQIKDANALRYGVSFDEESLKIARDLGLDLSTLFGHDDSPSQVTMAEFLGMKGHSQVESTSKNSSDSTHDDSMPVFEDIPCMGTLEQLIRKVESNPGDASVIINEFRGKIL